MKAPAREMAWAIATAGMLLCFLLLIAFGGREFIEYAGRMFIVSAAVSLLGVLVAIIVASIDDCDGEGNE